MKQIELEMPIAEMGEEDLRATLSDVMAAHESNVSEYSELVSEKEAAEADVETAKAYFAEKAEAFTQLSAELLQTRFSLSELVDMAGKADESEPAFSENAEPVAATEAEAETPEEPEQLFAERPQKSPAFTSDDDAMAQYAEAAKARLAHLSGIQLD